MSIFKVNPDISRAETLSSEFYTDENFFHESKEKIFARSWQLVGFDDDMTANLKPFTLLEDFLDEPILFTRDHSGNVHCLSNVCTHRGNILIEENCRENGIRCRYHGKRFDFSGKFLSMPEFDAAANFPTEKDDLPELPFAAWENFLFVSLDPFAVFEIFTAEMRERVKHLEIKNFKFSAELSREYEVKAHWALYCENYLEGFHLPFVHQSLNSAVEYGTYATETFRFSSLQTALAKFTEDAFEFPETSPDFGKRAAAYYFFVFPNLMFNFYPWGLSVNIVKPVNPEKTKVSFLSFVADETKLQKGAGADLHRVEMEDEAIVENVQRGIKSRFYKNGRYSPAREQGTHHFHRLIAEFME